jgi:hypothetical protein
MTEPVQSDPNRRRELLRAATRAVLRAIPVVGAPELLDILEAAKRSRRSVDSKIEQAMAALQAASQLVDELETDLRDRTSRLNHLREEVDKYSKLAAIEEDKARALVVQLDSLLSRDRGRERWVSLAINLVAGLLIFVLGIVAGPRLARWWQGRNTDNSTVAAPTPSLQPLQSTSSPHP